MNLKFLLFITLSLELSAQQGRVGINTTTPSSTLDVNGLKDPNTGLTFPTDASGIQVPQLTLAQLAAKGNALYGPDQNGTIVQITDVTNSATLSTGQRLLITSTGYYYFDAPNNEWFLLSMPYGERLPDWKLIATYEYTKTDAPQIVNYSNNSYNDLNGFTQSITIPAGKQAKIYINYSIPVASEWSGTAPNATPNVGYMGVTLRKDGVELPRGSRKSTIVRLSGNGTIPETLSLVNLAATTIDEIAASPTAQTITYQLQGYIENTFNAPIRFGATNRGAWNFVVYIR